MAQTAIRNSAIPRIRTVLSFVPKVVVAKSFSHGGVRSTNAPPTANTGEGVPPASPVPVIRAASRVATPTVKTPATTPSVAAHDRLIRLALHGHFESGQIAASCR
jgi:hypothetical protein